MQKMLFMDFTELFEDWCRGVFGADVEVKGEEFIRLCGEDGNSWIFDPNRLRKAMAAKVGLSEDKW